MPAKRSGRVPLGVWVLAGLELVSAIADGLYLARFDPWPGESLVVQVLQSTTLSDAAVAVSGVLSLLAAIGLVLGLRWAWVLTMLLVGLGLAFDLAFMLDGDAVRIRLLVEAVMALYLNQRAVREAFEGSPATADGSPATVVS